MVDRRARERQRAAAVGGPEEAQRALGSKLLPAEAGWTVYALAVLGVPISLSAWMTVRPIRDQCGRLSWRLELRRKQIEAGVLAGPRDGLRGYYVDPAIAWSWSDHERAAVARRERLALERAAELERDDG